jgi:hypothetical protein
MKKLYDLIETETHKVFQRQFLTPQEAEEHNRTLSELQEPYRWVISLEGDHELVEA